MKKIKKLKLRPGQMLDALQQQNVMAAGYGDWQGACSCTQVGNSHVETCVEQSTVVDNAAVILGGIMIATGLMIAVSGLADEVPSLGASTAIVASGLALAGEGKQLTDSSTRTLTKTWKRVMTCTHIKPIAHKAGKPTCTSTLL